jgi:DNA-binding CsgD family transcriptional regulator
MRYRHQEVHEIDERIDLVELIDTLWILLSPMEAAVAQMIMNGYTKAQTAQHFEMTKQAVDTYLNLVKGKLLLIEYLIENNKLLGLINQVEDFLEGGGNENYNFERGQITTDSN